MEQLAIKRSYRPHTVQCGTLTEAQVLVCLLPIPPKFEEAELCCRYIIAEGNKAVEEKNIQVVEVVDMVLVPGSDTWVRAHMADYIDCTCMDCSPWALASGNTCGGEKKAAHLSCKTLIMLIYK